MDRRIGQAIAKSSAGRSLATSRQAQFFSRAAPQIGACAKRLQAKTKRRDGMMLFIYYLGWAKIKFRKWANYDCRNQTGLDPRQYSFTRVQDLINTWLPHLASITSERKRKAEFERMMKYVPQCRLYKRKNRSAYPRTIWLRRRKFPTRKEKLNQTTSANAVEPQ
jgi:hypothetical protein